MCNRMYMHFLEPTVCVLHWKLCASSACPSRKRIGNCDLPPPLISCITLRIQREKVPMLPAKNKHSSGGWLQTFLFGCSSSRHAMACMLGLPIFWIGSHRLQKPRRKCLRFCSATIRTKPREQNEPSAWLTKQVSQGSSLPTRSRKIKSVASCSLAISKFAVEVGTRQSPFKEVPSQKNLAMVP